MTRKRRDAGDLSFLKIDKPRAQIVTFRLRGEDVQRLEALGRRLSVGRSKMARLIVENFISKHHRER